MNDEKKPFTVTDRRHFDAEGETRPEAGDGPVADRPGAGKAADADGAGPPVDAEPPVTFAGFVAGLAAQATMLLGLGSGSEAEAPQVDLKGARHVISILEMLKDKTEGRRSPEEDRVIEAILYELRMVYVTQAGGR